MSEETPRRNDAANARVDTDAARAAAESGQPKTVEPGPPGTMESGPSKTVEPGQSNTAEAAPPGADTEKPGCWVELRPHLVELRGRIVFIFVFFAAASVAGFLCAKWIYAALIYPLPPDVTLNFFGVAEAFFTDVKIGVAAALVLSVPVAGYQLWRFVSPGMKPYEKRIITGTVPWVALLFAIGALFTFFFVAPAGLTILLGWGRDRLTPVISVGKYTSFLFGLILAGGVLFELPVVMVALAKLGFVTRETLLRHARTAVVIILFAAAILTPSPDAFTMLILAVPIIALYFGGIVLVGFVKPAGESGKAREQ